MYVHVWQLVAALSVHICGVAALTWLHDYRAEIRHEEEQRGRRSLLEALQGDTEPEPGTAPEQHDAAAAAGPAKER